MNLSVSLLTFVSIRKNLKFDRKIGFITENLFKFSNKINPEKIDVILSIPDGLE